MDETKQLDLSNKVYKLVVAIIVLVAVFYFGQLVYSFQTLPQNYPQEISVSGQGKVYAKPDVVVLVLGVESKGIKISSIVEDNTDKMNKI
ncbi:MAG: SIMPL domain-containing protein, partial [Gemmatimonadaceae bacterium]|nr:SIMPL domain-containing protein [Gemmatimonadaceae bacterium]